MILRSSDPVPKDRITPGAIRLKDRSDILLRSSTEDRITPRRRRIIHTLLILIPLILSVYLILAYLGFILGRG